MSYRLKLIITISLLIALSFSIGGTLMITTSFNATLTQEIQSSLTAYENTQHTLFLLNSLGEQSDFESLANALKQMEDQNLGQWQALSLKAGKDRIYLSGNEDMLNQTVPSPTENQCTTLTVFDQYGCGLLVKSILYAGITEIEVLARFDLSHAYSLRNTQQQQYLIVYTVVVCFGVVASVVLSFVLTRHLHRLTVTVRKISGGDLSRRSQIRSQDEFGQLSRDFDVMADKLQENISRLETDVQRQESFMGAFAHELKTPMTSIIGFADLLRQGNMDESTRIVAAEYIYSEGRRLERLSFKLLELLLLKKDSINMSRVWLNAYLAEVEQAMASNMKAKNIQLICKSETKRVTLEPDLVKSLLYNLIDNASKAMDEGGIIVVRGSAISGGCRIQVADNGRGMEPEELTKITEAFYRVDKARSRTQGGAGLGLSLCKQIVELHNGSIHFDSTPEIGTCVTVILYGKVEQGDD